MNGRGNLNPEKRNILIFSTADWDNPFWTNKQHMAVLFAKRGYRVLYVDSLGLRRPTLRRRDMGRIARRLCQAIPIARQVRPNLWRVSPIALPIHQSAAARALNTRLLRAALNWHLACLKMPSPLIWTYNPVIADLCASIPNSGIVYHCVDDLGAAPRIDGAVIAAGEKHLGTVSGLCFATSTLLRERMRGLFPRVFYEPNVCDQAFFETARAMPSPPFDLVGIPRPRILFVGALSEYKVDYSLMETLAGRNPAMHWVLIGPVGEGQPDSRQPPLLPNIHVLGPRAYGQLPYFMAHCDAAALPVPRNAYTEAMFPMKFFEFLAAGLPLVGSRLPALREFETLYFASDSAEEFQDNLVRVLKGQRRDRKAIDKACRHHSWEARFTRMEAVLDKVFPVPKIVAAQLAGRAVYA
ncbi:MAG: glycosyltransferase [Desulfarculales bacterium]|jgi:glycosyltransferase involved in cell wall biosynthesis|nr:glycosyltransferase [Desulfarculales bacterium]